MRSLLVFLIAVLIGAVFASRIKSVLTFLPSI